MRAKRALASAVIAAVLAAACAETPSQETESPPASAPLRLIDTSWVLSDPHAPASAQAPTLEFAEGDRASGFAGCNQWFAQVDTANGGLRFSAIGMTRRACPAPAMEIEQRFGATLAATQSATREGDTLVLMGAEGAPIAHFALTR
ncbi:MAG: META domain-containing protein [Hyphomonadaceae bacterium]